MIKIGAFEAKNKLSALLDRVEQGETIVITRHGKAIAKLVPDTSAFDSPEAYAASERIRARAQQIKSGPFNWEAFKNDRDHGRP